MRLLASLKRFWRRSTLFRLYAWDGAGQGRRFSQWQTETASVNRLLEGDGDVLRARSRHLARNNPYAANAIEALVANVIGTGIKPQSKARDHDFRQAVQKL